MNAAPAHSQKLIHSARATARQRNLQTREKQSIQSNPIEHDVGGSNSLTTDLTDSNAFKLLSCRLLWKSEHHNLYWNLFFGTPFASSTLLCRRGVTYSASSELIQESPKNSILLRARSSETYSACRPTSGGFHRPTNPIHLE